MTDTINITLADIQAAAKVLEGQIERTALRHSKTLSAITGAEVWVKFENRQFTAAFKERGALNKLSRLTEAQKEAGVIAASAGNHAQGVAYHARRLKIPATIVMPVTTPFTKVEHTRDHGARVVLEGLTFDEAKAHADVLCQREGLTFIHPFDDPDIIAGQGTIALEMLEDEPELDTLVVLNTCQHPFDPNPEYAPKPVEIAISEAPAVAEDDPSLQVRSENQRAFHNTTVYNKLRF